MGVTHCGRKMVAPAVLKCQYPSPFDSLQLAVKLARMRGLERRTVLVYSLPTTRFGDRGIKDGRANQEATYIDSSRFAANKHYTHKGDARPRPGRSTAAAARNQRFAMSPDLGPIALMVRLSGFGVG